jgi:hypothetical protein
MCMNKDLAAYLNGETEKLKGKQRRYVRKQVSFTIGQLAMVYESLHSHFDFLGDIIASDLFDRPEDKQVVRAERKVVGRLLKKVSNLP